MRPFDLAREHGISTQAVRNYERDGFLPPAGRTPSGYRAYTEAHAAALRAYLALVAAYGYATAGRVMRAVHGGRLDEALAAIDEGHAVLRRDRATLAAVREALGDLAGEPPAAPGTLTIGDLAHRLSLTPATLRKWEEAGVLVPARDPATHYRTYAAPDVRDADLAHLLRRGGHPLEQVAAVLDRIRTAGGTQALAESLGTWQSRLTDRGRAMLRASGLLDAYLDGHPGGHPDGPVDGPPDRPLDGHNSFAFDVV
ncbi:TioE family transcriptional regulator [Streptomyces sp. NPDC001941]|uniref:TioE family transcriptional regulator n=1 Tax=Streptomyces sp. NPDC001941 TaxID=3154659 RepID=UPI003319D4EE